MGLCVMTPGDIKMPLLFVDNLDSPPMVRMNNSQNSQLRCYCHMSLRCSTIWIVATSLYFHCRHLYSR